MENIYISSDTESTKLLKLGEIALSSIILLGFMLLFVPFGCGAAQMAWGLAALLFLELTAGHRHIRTIAAAGLALITVSLFSSFSGGMLAFLNSILTLLNRKFSLRLTSFAAEATAFNLNVFFSVLFCGGALFVTTREKRGKNIIIAIVLFSLFEFFSLIGLKPSPVALAGVIAALAMCWARLGLRTGHSERARFAAAIAAAVIALALGLIFSDYTGSYKISQLSRNIGEAIETIRYGSSDLPSGDMRKAAGMEQGDDEVLTVTSENTTLSEAYLGGFSGVVYDKRGIWSAHDGKTFEGEWNGIFRWLEEQGFSAQEQYAHYVKLTSPNAPSEVITVKNQGGNRKFLYVSHSYGSITKGKLTDDLYITSNSFFGAKSYSFETTSFSGTENEMMLAILNSDSLPINSQAYLKAEAVYSSFVNETYKSIDEQDEEMLNEIFFNTDYLTRESGLYSIITRIRAILELRVEYTRNPPTYASDKSFIDWFLNDAKRGNSAYFATVGAIALRAAGFPARYTEGYYISDGSSETTVTERNSHSWVEVYVNRVGWLPVEFTPGYYNSSLRSSQTVEISKDVAGGGTNEESPYAAAEEYSDTDDGDESTENQKSNINPIQIAAIAGIGLLVVAVGILIRAAFIVLLRRKRLNLPNSARYTYDRIFKMLSLGGVNCDKTRPAQCADSVVEHFKGIRRQEYLRLIALMQKNVFGDRPLNARELRSVNMFCAKVRRLLYKKSGRIKRILLRFIYCV